MLLSVQQKYIMEILRKLGYIRREQLRTLVQGRFSELEISECRMVAMLRQLRYATGDVHLDNSAVWLGEAQPDFQRLEAVDVMLELSEGRPQDFSVKCQSPELLRFTLEGGSLRLFTVATISAPLHTSVQARDSPGRVVWISDSGTAPPGLTLPPKHFCTGGKKARRFKRSGPKIAVPQWCPKRKNPCELRVYALKSIQDWHLLRLLPPDPNDPICISEHRYALASNSKIELTPQEFWKRCQNEPWTDLLVVDTPLYSVVEIDDGLAPAFFYRTMDGLRIAPHFNTEKARTNRMEETV